MILRWLAGYSLGYLIQIAAGCIICLSSGYALLHQREDGKRPPWLSILAGFLWGACFMASPVLRAKPQWVGLSHALTMAGVVFGVIRSVSVIRHSKSKQAAVPSPSQHAAPSDEIWPPPPTAPGG